MADNEAKLVPVKELTNIFAGTCGKCQFLRITSSDGRNVEYTKDPVTYTPTYWMCTRYPDWIDVGSDHYCGEYQEKENTCKNPT